MKEGEIVIIASKVPEGWTHIGTFIGQIGNNLIQVLLPSLFIFTGPVNSIYSHKEENIDE